MLYTANPDNWYPLLSRPIETRVEPGTAELADFITACNQAAGNPIPAVAAEIPPSLAADISAAIAGLPENVKTHLTQRLLGVFPMRGVGSSAVVDIIALANQAVIGAFVAIDLDIIGQKTANQWATWKENTAFTPCDDCFIEAEIASTENNTRVTALQYLLLHEFGHILADQPNALTAWWQHTESLARFADSEFSQIGWQPSPNDTLRPKSGTPLPWLEQLSFYARAELPASAAADIYRQLAETQLPSLYAALNPHEDFAESFATYVHHCLLGRPLAFHVRRHGKTLATLENFWATERSPAKRDFFNCLLAQPPTEFSHSDLPAAAQRRSLIEQAQTEFVGLAPFLRASIANDDLRLIAQPLLEEAGRQEMNAALWMNLSTAMFCLNQHELGLSIQQQALSQQSVFVLPAKQTPAKFTVLVLLVPGDVAANTPIDCLLENTAIDLIYQYLAVDCPLPEELPNHDALLVAISDGPANRPLLHDLAVILDNWPRPTLNQPGAIPHTERAAASALLGNIPGVLMPPTHAVDRAAVTRTAKAQRLPSHLAPDLDFPFIIRPVGSQAGRDLARIANATELQAYLSTVDAAVFYVSQFIDYSSGDGLFRKFRLTFVNGAAYAAHMAVSANWMIHYVNAGMYDDADKRAEEARFMADFDQFRQRHETALSEIARRTGLDYFCIDAAETRDGRLLIFEMDHIMVVHAMDPAPLFPYKAANVSKIVTAFEATLRQRCASFDPENASST